MGVSAPIHSRSRFVSPYSGVISVQSKSQPIFRWCRFVSPESGLRSLTHVV